MKRLVIYAHGDNTALHKRALEAAVKAIEAINHAPVAKTVVEDMSLDEQMRHWR